MATVTLDNQIEIALTAVRTQNELLKQSDITLANAYINGGIGEAELHYNAMRKEAKRLYNEYRNLIDLKNTDRVLGYIAY